MKIAVLSDTHLSRVTSEFENLMESHLSGVDLVLHAGDWVRAEVLEYLETYPLAAVSGNMDDGTIQSRLPYKRVVKANGKRLGLIHGWGTGLDLEQRVETEFDAVDAIIYGHSHRPVFHWTGGTLFFNPGSTTQNRGLNYNTMGLITIGQSIDAQIIKL
jgi:putative phosphoesterase